MNGGLERWREALRGLQSVSGSTIVTNEAGTGVLSVGRIGTGELALRGGSVVADTLLATNGGRSVLTFGHGELTTLHGVTISNASKVTLGTSGSNAFVWNAIGGLNRIITGQFDYGGLTLGQGGSRARVNLAVRTPYYPFPDWTHTVAMRFLSAAAQNSRLTRSSWGFSQEASAMWL